MIVECPSCSSQFSLPVERVTAKGAKVRCSKCGHTFRVQLGEDGQPEVFQKNEGVADPPTMDLSTLFEDSAADELGESVENEASRTQLGAPAKSAESLRSTMIGPPTGSKSASPDYNPFPFAALGDERSAPKQSVTGTLQKHIPASGIDLFDDDQPSAATLTTPSQAELDPFSDVFESSSSKAEDKILAPATPRARVAAAPVSVAPAPAGMPTKKPMVSALPVDVPVKEDVEQPSPFGAAEELVDDSFGQDSAYFDPTAGVVEAPAAARPAPRPLPARNPARAPVAAPKPAAAPVAPPVRAIAEAEFDAPHRIGGGGFQKFINFVLILILAVGAVLGYIAFRTGGVLDFGQFDNMMEVLVEGKPYTPRKEWIPAVAPVPVVEAPKPLVAVNVVGRLLPLGKKDAVFVVTGDVLNESGDPKEPAKVRVMLLDDQQRVLAELEATTGRVLEFEDIAGSKNAAEIKALSPSSPKGINAGAQTPFMAVFTDPPAAAREHRALNLRVEIP